MDPHLLGRLIDEHAAALELYAAQWTGAPEDVVQDAFIKLAGQQTLPERIVPWLYRVVRNRAISRVRSAVRRRKHETVCAGLKRAWFVPNNDDAIDAAMATAALQELPAECCEVVVARLWGGLSFQEISEVVEVSTSTAHRRYQAGLKELRDRLGVTWLNETSSPTS